MSEESSQVEVKRLLTYRYPPLLAIFSGGGALGGRFVAPFVISGLTHVRGPGPENLPVCPRGLAVEVCLPASTLQAALGPKKGTPSPRAETAAASTSCNMVAGADNTH